MSRLQDKFKKEITKNLQKSLDIKSPMGVPRLEKIVVNIGVKDATQDKKNIEKASLIMSQILGQKPKWTSAKRAIAGFRLRQGDQIGLLVTLRGKRMYNFFEKLITIVLPRLRDFHGVKRESFDGHGNYTLGFAESTVFPEIDPGKVDKIQGLEITIVTNAKDNKEGFTLFKELGMPFAK